MQKTRISSVLLLSVTVLLPSCASAPLECPKLPEVPASVMAQPEESYLQRMQKLLQGSLPTPTKPSLPSESVKGGSGR